jgi:hypothetical protein
MRITIISLRKLARRIYGICTINNDDENENIWVVVVNEELEYEEMKPADADYAVTFSSGMR